MTDIKNFSLEEFEKIFKDIFNEKIVDSAIKDFLTQINKAEIPQNAILAAVNILKSKMIHISAPKNAIDLCGTGGDKLNTLNISTAVSFIVASAGIPVAKHGNKAMSSKSGSADIFTELNINFSNKISEIEKNIREKNFSFLFAPLFHPALKTVSEIRKSLKVPTIFNFLGPLLNPANVRYQIIGVSKKEMIKKMAFVISQNKQAKAFFVHGFDGMDEITITDNSYLVKVENGEIFEEEIINPEEFGIKKVDLKEIAGKDPKYNAQKLIDLFNGEISPYQDIICLNAAYAFYLVKKTKTPQEGFKLAKEIINSKKPLKLLKDLQLKV